MLRSVFSSMLRVLRPDAPRTAHSAGEWSYPEPPEWMHTAPMPSAADYERGDYILNAMGNHRHRAADATLRRNQWGEDYRLKYLLLFLDVRDLAVLELGPFWGYHSLMLDKMGAARIVGVEGRENNIRTCENVKQCFGLDRATFVLQDIEGLAKGEQPQFSGPFDLVFCLGLLYHMPDPLSILRWCRHQAPSLFLGTHYFEPSELDRYRLPLFEVVSTAELSGGRFAGAWYQEGGLSDGPSGLSERSFWPCEKDLYEMLRLAGYRHVNVLGRDLHNNMPHVTLIAE